jgi:inner membrane transporter RhtA
MSQSQKAVAAAFLSLMSLQVGAAFAKTIFPLVGPEGVAALRIGIAAVLLSVFLRPWTMRFSKDQWVGLLIYGVMIAAMNLLIYRAFFYIPVGIAISIEVLGPLGVAMVLSRRKIDFLWIAFALTGLALLPLGIGGQSLDLRGVAFTLAAAICWAIYIVIGGKVASIGSRGVAIGMTIASLFVVPIGVAHAGPALFSPGVLMLGLVVSVMSSALPFLLDIYALRTLPRNVFGVLMSASPAVSAIAGAIVLGEYLSVLQWCGIAAITVACLGVTMAPLWQARRIKDIERQSH